MVIRGVPGGRGGGVLGRPNGPGGETGGLVGKLDRKKDNSKTVISKHSGTENLKKARPKKLVKSTKSISRKFFLTKIHFLQFQKGPKINF